MNSWIENYRKESSGDLTLVLVVGLSIAYIILVLPKKVVATMIGAFTGLVTLSFLQHRKLSFYRSKYGDLTKK